jgi:hypothetical protein
MDPIMMPVYRMKMFVAKHKVAFAVVGTAVTCIAINQRALKLHNEFLKEKGLFEEFYAPTDEEGNAL